MTASEAKRLRLLESENARLKRLLSERTFGIGCLKRCLKKGLGPSRCRIIQQALVRDWGLSIRSSCRLAGMSRSHLNQPRLIAEDALKAEIWRLAYKHPRFGYRRIHALLKGQGWQINVKRVRRIWREEGPVQSPSTLVRRDMDALECKSERNAEGAEKALA